MTLMFIDLLQFFLFSVWTVAEQAARWKESEVHSTAAPNEVKRTRRKRSDSGHVAFHVIEKKETSNGFYALLIPNYIKKKQENPFTFILANDTYDINEMQSKDNSNQNGHRF